MGGDGLLDLSESHVDGGGRDDLLGLVESHVLLAEVSKRLMGEEDGFAVSRGKQNYTALWGAVRWRCRK